MADLSGRTIGRNALWSMLSNSSGQILALAVFLVTARFVDKDAFGVMAVCMVAVEFFRQIVIEGVGHSLAAHNNPDSDDYNAGFFLIIAGSILSAAIMFLLAYPVAVLLKDPAIEPALRMTSLVLLAMGLSRTHETWMARNMMFKILAIRSIFAYVIGGGVGIYMAMHGYGLTSLIVQQILTSVLSMVLLWVSSQWRPSLQYKADKVKPLFAYSKHVSLNAFTGVIGAQSDTFFATYYLGTTATGIYNAAKRIILAIQMMSTSGMNSVALPVFANTASNPQTLRAMHLSATGITAFLIVPLYFGLMVMAKDFISLILGEKWLDAAPILSALCLTAALASLDIYNWNIRMVRGKPQWQTVLTALNAVINVMLLVGIARFGLMAMAYAMLLKSLIMFPVSLSMAFILIDGKFKDYLREIYPSVTASAIMAGIVYYIHTYLFDFSPLANIALMVPMGIVIYLGVFTLLDRKRMVAILAAARNMIKHE